MNKLCLYLLREKKRKKKELLIAGIPALSKVDIFYDFPSR